MIELMQRNITEQNADTMNKKIGILEGCFDIDPNRVSDIVLEAFEQSYGLLCNNRLLILCRQS
jgi:hypothetical protein